MALVPSQTHFLLTKFQWAPSELSTGFPFYLTEIFMYLYASIIFLYPTLFGT